MDSRSYLFETRLRSKHQSATNRWSVVLAVDLTPKLCHKQEEQKSRAPSGVHIARCAEFTCDCPHYRRSRYQVISDCTIRSVSILPSASLHLRQRMRKTVVRRSHKLLPQPTPHSCSACIARSNGAGQCAMAVR